MTYPQNPVYLDPATFEILTHCYRDESNRDVVARAVRLLATADEHLTPGGRIKTGTGRLPATRRTP